MIPRRGPINCSENPFNLITQPLNTFARLGHKKAIIGPQGRSITFWQLRDQVEMLSALLLDQGVQKGDRIYLLVPMDIELYILVAALFKIGAIVVFIDPWAKRDYIHRCLQTVAPQYLIYIAKAKILTLLHPDIKKIPVQWDLSQLLLKAQQEYIHAPTRTYICPMDPEDTALVTFTTGSTGMPKGMDRTHGLLLAQQQAHEKYLCHQEVDVDLVMFPVFVLSNLASGLTSVIVQANIRKIAAANGEKLIAQMREHQVSSLTASPALLEVLARWGETNTQKLPFLSKIFTGGAPVDPQLFNRLRPLFPKAEMYLVYGSTEAEPIALARSEMVLSLDKENGQRGKGVLLGDVVEDLRFRLLTLDQQQHLAVPQDITLNTPGEIILSGGYVGKKYYQNEQAFNQNKIVDGQGDNWHRTGDIGIVYEENGPLYMLGRKNSVIWQGDCVFYPLQVEPLLNQLPFVQKSCFFQYNKEKKTTGILLVPGKNFYRQKMSQYLQEVKKLLQTKGIVADKILFVSSLPVDRRHNSKIDYERVRARYGEEKNMQTMKVAKSLWGWSKERFPFVAVAFFTLCLGLDIASITQLAFVGHTQWTEQMFAGLWVLFFIFFHLRVFDEVKDYEKDKVAHPQRLLSRGEVLLSDLIKAGIWAVGSEALISAWWGVFPLSLYLGILLYSYLMYREFFIPEQLNRSITAYLVSHQLIVPLMILFMMSMSLPQGQFSFTHINNIFTSPLLLTGILYIVLLQLTYEIARKTWSADREHPLADSYTKVWGTKKTSCILLLLNCGILGCAHSLIQGFHLSLAGQVVALSNFLQMLVFTMRFWTAPTYKNSKMVELGGTLLLLIGHINLIVLCWSLS